MRSNWCPCRLRVWALRAARFLTHLGLQSGAMGLRLRDPVRATFLVGSCVKIESQRNLTHHYDPKKSMWKKMWIFFDMPWPKGVDSHVFDPFWVSFLSSCAPLLVTGFAPRSHPHRCSVHGRIPLKIHQSKAFPILSPFSNPQCSFAHGRGHGLNSVLRYKQRF